MVPFITVTTSTIIITAIQNNTPVTSLTVIMVTLIVLTTTGTMLALIAFIFLLSKHPIGYVLIVSVILCAKIKPHSSMTGV